MVQSETQHVLPTYEPATEHVSQVGYISKTDSIPVYSEGKWHTDPHAERIVKQFAKDEYDPSAFGIATPSHLNVIESFRKYEKIDVYPEMPIHVRMEEEVRPAVQEMYSMLWKQCRVISLDECLYVPGTSPGPVLKIMGFPTKESTLKALRGYFEWYTDWGFLSAPPPLYKQNGKIELLKASKMANGVSGIRGFTVPPMDELLLQSRYMQDANLKIDELGADITSPTYSLVGANLKEGGFIRLFDAYSEHIKGGGRVWKGDVFRMDSCETTYLLSGARELRERLHDPRSCALPKFRLAMDHIYTNLCNTFTLLPNGQIVQKWTGMPSGALSTSNDGTHVHEQVLAWHWLRVTDKPVSQMQAHLKAKLYCDDHIAAVDAQFSHVADFKERDKSYSQLGLKLQPADDEVSETLEGMTLLGFQSRNGLPVPARRQKFFHGLSRPNGPRDVNTTLQRAVSFMDAAAYEDELFAIARNVAMDSMSRGATWMVGEDKDWTHVPSQKECKMRWEGKEGSSRAYSDWFVSSTLKEETRNAFKNSYLFV